jgi:PBP1b-binding outer membrane lipoprotein LpoB
MKLATAFFNVIIVLLICLFVSACVTDQAATNSRGSAPAKTTKDMYHPREDNQGYVSSTDGSVIKK